MVSKYVLGRVAFPLLDDFEAAQRREHYFLLPFVFLLLELECDVFLLAPLARETEQLPLLSCKHLPKLRFLLQPQIEFEYLGLSKQLYVQNDLKS